MDLAGRSEALQGIHAPVSFSEQHRARRRLAFDELLRLQLLLVAKKLAAAATTPGIAHRVAAPDGDPSLVEQFLAGLPFELTSAQRRAIEEIAGDLAARHPMHRLLQGDVGSGKTVVALATLLVAVQGGHQGALMVPTEVLAEQHHLAARQMLESLYVPDPDRLGGRRPVAVALLTSKTPAGERARLQAELADGRLDLVVGTHALLTEEVRFRSLGVVVIDEQHRFGVEQRAALREKGPSAEPDADASTPGGATGDGDEAANRHPDVLVMTATPIPRTAAMTVYGDFDQTVLDELPAGRTPIRTVWLEGPDAAPAAWDRVRAEVDAGRQAYVICPLVGGGAPEDDGEGFLADDEGEEAPATGEREPGAHAPDLGAREVALPLPGVGAAEDLVKEPPRAVTEEVERLRSGELAGYSRRPAARPAALEGEGGRHGRIPLRRARRCWWPRR